MLNAFRFEYSRNAKNASSFVKIDDEKATQYYIKHACNAIAMTQMLTTQTNLSFNEKHELREMLTICERKRDYFYRKNVDMKNAIIVINAFKNAR